MNPSPIILVLASLVGFQAHAAPAPADAALIGVPMSVATRLDARPRPEGLAAPAMLSGVPMVVATRLDASRRSGQVSGATGRMLSGVPMALAKRL